jgi:transcriptional regulator with XRE-family HTH domain
VKKVLSFVTFDNFFIYNRMLEGVKTLKGKRLANLRGKKTQQEIADKLGISRARYSHYENEHVEPDNELLSNIAELFNVSADYLLGISDNPRLSGQEEQLVNERVRELFETLQTIPDKQRRKELEEEVLAYAKFRKNTKK